MKEKHPLKKLFLVEKIVLHHFFQFFLHKSLLKHIIDGFEHLETWGIDRGIPWFNYGVEWADRMPIHGHFTF